METQPRYPAESTCSLLSGVRTPAAGRVAARRVSSASLRLLGFAIAAIIFNCVPAMAQETPATAQEIIDNVLDSASQKSNAKGHGHGHSNTQTCVIIVTDDGEIYNMPGTNMLTSMGAGGRPGRATVYASHNSFRLSIDPPRGFSVAPPQGNNNVVFNTSFSGRGATDFSYRPGGSSQKLKDGVTQVEAHFEANRGSDTFPAGQYRAQLTLRCE